MSSIIERVRISAIGKQQLSTLKRRTGIEHYNVICRHALCASLANSTKVPTENLQYNGGLEIDWSTFAGEAAATLTNLLILRAVAEQGDSSPLAVRDTLQSHVHRGLAYLISDPNSLCSKGLSLS
ncbi:MAG: DNA sulfur modification protein DndE [Piscinibacter sp.]